MSVRRFRTLCAHVRHRADRDALVDLCAHALDCGAIPQRASQRSHVQVTTSLETLLDLVGSPAGEMERAGAIAAATVHRVACDSTITRVLLDPRSQVIDVGRSQRVVGGGSSGARRGAPSTSATRDAGGQDASARHRGPQHTMSCTGHRAARPTSPTSSSVNASPPRLAEWESKRLEAGCTGRAREQGRRISRSRSRARYTRDMTVPKRSAELG